MANLTKTTLDFDDGSQQVFEAAPVVTANTSSITITAPEGNVTVTSGETITLTTTDTSQ